MSALCDRQKVNVSKAQTGFITYIARPLFDIWVHFIEGLHDRARAAAVGNSAASVMPWNEGGLLLRHLEENLKRWEAGEDIDALR